MDRYELRNTAYKMRNNKTPVFPEVVKVLEPLLEEKGFNWAGFPDTWDVVQVKGETKVIHAVRDLREAETVCAQQQMVVKVNAEPDFDARELAIVESIEAQFLEGIMDWLNYRDEWNLAKDDQGRIVTKLIKRKPAQKIEITQEVLDEKIKEQLKKTSGSEDTQEARESVTPVKYVTKVVE